jgi:hypothetical protein
MKRIKRDSERFDVFELFERISRKRSLDLRDPLSHNSFIDAVSKGFAASKSSPITLHGKRIESMFEHVVAGLGKAVLIKREDSGDVCTIHENVQPPDFRIVLDGGLDVFVEVKNHHKAGVNTRLSFSKTYLSSLQTYAKIFNRELYIAIFWSRWKTWTLVRPDQLAGSERPSISFDEAIVKNNMSLLGDMVVGTTPPLSLRLVADTQSAREIDNHGECTFRIAGMEVLCNGVQLEKALEKNLALYFILYSTWQVNEPEAKLENGHLSCIEYTSQPIHSEEGQGFQTLGTLSGMISRHYNLLTSDLETVAKLSPASEPGILEVAIPRDYEAEGLPLWLFIISPREEPKAGDPLLF